MKIVFLDKNTKPNAKDAQQKLGQIYKRVLSYHEEIVLSDDELSVKDESSDEDEKPQEQKPSSSKSAKKKERKARIK